MTVAGAILKSVGIAIVVIVGAVLLTAAVPALRAQVRHEPLVDVRTLVMGGSEIGVRMRDVTSEDVTREKLPAAAGAIVTEVRSGGPAAAAGFTVGDVVLSFDGEKVRSARHLSRLIEETPEGREVAVEMMRNGSTVTLRVRPRAAESFSDLRGLNRLQERLQERLPLDRFEFRGLDSFVFPDHFTLVRPGRIGAHLQDVSGQLAEYFGVSAAGALVTSVEDASAAKTAGLRAGDVITAVNSQPVRTSADVHRRLAGLEGKVVLTIVRDKKETTLDLTVTRDGIGRRGIIK
jgi:serine protease Do